MTPSPCTGVCRLDPHGGHCVACLRTLDEIGAWPLMDDDARRGLWSLLAARRQVMPLSLAQGQSPV